MGSTAWPSGQTVRRGGWGRNTRGQLGDGTVTSRNFPGQVTGLTDIITIKCGVNYTMALKDDGVNPTTVWAWGYNYYGQLGDGTNTQRNTPVQVKDSPTTFLTDVIAIGCGFHRHSIALKADGTVYTWGYNQYGQLGYGSTDTDRTAHTTAAQVSGLSGIEAIAIGYEHNMVLKDDGTFWGFGSNRYGQLGDGTSGVYRTSPVQAHFLYDGSTMTPPTPTTAAATVVTSNSARLMGTVNTEGIYMKARFVYGTSSDLVEPYSYTSQTPMIVENWSDGTIDVSAAISGLTSNTTYYYRIVAWNDGDGGAYQYGDEMSFTTSATAPPTLLSSGYYHTLALKEDGTVWAWGRDNFGQLGDGGANLDKTTPVQVSGLSNVTAVACGAYHNVALKSDGTVWTWGLDNYGQLGDGGNNTNKTIPVQVSGLTDVIAIAAGNEHTLALKSDGTVWACGYGLYGRLGLGVFDGTTHTTPAQVVDFTDFIAIGAGGEHSMAMRSDGTVWGWGRNTRGQLGDGTVTSRNFPGQVTGLTDIITIKCGVDYTMALKDEGLNPATVWAWGYNYYGTLGDGTNTQRNTPVQVKDSPTTFLDDVIAIGCGFLPPQYCP